MSCFRVVVCAALLNVSLLGSAHAQLDLGEHCDYFGRIAAGVMQARQNNVPMPEVMSRLDQVSSSGVPADFYEAMDSFVRDLVVRAYMRPVQTNDQARQREVATFANSIEERCSSAGR